MFRPLARAAGALFPGRFRIAGTMLALYVAVSFLTRLGLAAFNSDPEVLAPQRLLGWLGIGLLFDLGVSTFVALPFALLAWITPDSRGGRWLLAPLTLALALAACVFFAFVAASEFVFWNEFGTRFNFIAVDYLIYSREVIGNVRESYSLPLLLAAVGGVALALFALVARRLWRATAPAGSGFARRSITMALLTALPVASFFALDARYKDFTDHTPSAQLAGNGWFDFLSAFRHNEIDYARFYRTLPPARAAGILRHEFEDNWPTKFVSGARLPIEREVVAADPEKRLNVVLISVESLSADVLGAFGNKEGLTPRLDALAAQSLVFTRLYATGTRTVRGLEAISLSLPPTPGHSVVKRPNNDHLFTLGEVFAEHGYAPLYIYGGYSYFDNMQEFFGGNGYTVIDRSALAPADIHYENIWGVADEDLFTLALREIDARAAAGKPFFAHIMTTSNHRPFSYPEGRIDIPPGSGRAGAVKYTDWAIGDFIDRARKQAWFDNTVFVIVADQTASSRGKSELPLANYHIPLLIYAPGHIAPRRVDSVASQIDLAPTLLALLNFSYRSRFFGQDILAEGQKHQRALMANYQTVGYLEDGVMVELRPKGRTRFVDTATGQTLPEDDKTRYLLGEAIAYYETAAEALRAGWLRTDDQGAAAKR
ncbi:MAG: LTA synthase family protein [Betaproteobacteria bacterium]